MRLATSQQKGVQGQVVIIYSTCVSEVGWNNTS